MMKLCYENMSVSFGPQVSMFVAAIDFQIPNDALDGGEGQNISTMQILQLVCKTLGT